MKSYMSVILMYHHETGVLAFKTKKDNTTYEFPFYETRLELSNFFRKPNAYFCNLKVKNLKNDRYKYTYEISKNAQVEIECLFVLAENKSMNNPIPLEEYEEVKVIKFNKSFSSNLFEPVYRKAVEYLHDNICGLQPSIKQYDFDKIESVPKITREELKQIIDKKLFVEEPNIPFPQADDFNKIVSIGNVLVSDCMVKKEIVNRFNFVPRQADYYVNAGRYLGLFLLDGDCVSLTDEAKRIFSLSKTEINNELIKTILSHRVFSFVLSVKLLSNIALDKKNIVEIMKNFELYKIDSDDTYLRRASTINRWTDWILLNSKK